MIRAVNEMVFLPFFRKFHASKPYGAASAVKIARAIRALEDERYHKLPIVTLTANNVNGEQNEYLKAGMSNCIGKPIMMEDIYTKIRKWLPEEKIKYLVYCL